MQLIGIFESRPKCDSDYKYIKSIIDFHYGIRACKITKIDARNKSELIKQDTKINKYKKDYNGETKVVLFADVDLNDSKQNGVIADYCQKHGYYLVWMNSDVEEVVLGHKVKSRNKTREANNFLKRKDSIIGNLTNLNEPNPLNVRYSSNLLRVLDQLIK